MSDLLKFLRGIPLNATGKWFLLSALIGAVSGLGALTFYWLSRLIAFATLVSLAGFQPGDAVGEPVLFHLQDTTLVPWALVGVMALGGLASGLLVHFFAPEAEGAGTGAAINAFHNQRGEIRGRVPLIKTLASAITLGTGGSAGREGPIVQIGAGFGSYLATRLKLSARDRRILLAAGMGAGVGAIFRAPLAGALFAGEILYREADLEADVIVPAAVSSTVAYSVFSLALPSELRFAPLFGQISRYEVTTLLEMIPYSVLALVLVAVGVLYIKAFHTVGTLFDRLPTPPHLKPMIGATLAGLVGLGVYYCWGKDLDALAVLGSGYGTLQKTFHAVITLDVSLLLVIAGIKVVTTSLTISSGGSGGVFGPSMVIGGCLGAAVGQMFHSAMPTVVPQPQAFAIVGMAGFFAGCARAPFSTIIMVTEMTGDYTLLLPTMWVATLCFLLGSRWTLYKNQAASRLDSPAHRGDFIVDVLEGIRVEDVFHKGRRLVKFHEGTSLDDIVHALATTQQRYFPVVDDNDRMIGIFSAEDVRAYLYDDAIWKIANAGDVMVDRVLTVTPEDDLNTALTRFTSLNIDELPVVAVDDPTTLLGILRRKETIAAYNRELFRHKQASE